MIAFIGYMVKSGISLLVLYLFYWLILRKTTHFRINRLFLTASVILSLVLPGVATRISWPLSVPENIPAVNISLGSQEDIPLLQEKAAFENSPSPNHGDPGNLKVGIWSLLTILYFSGAFVVFARLIYQAIFLHAVAKLSEKKRFGDYTLVSMSTDTIPFSYFKRIFIPAASIHEGLMDSVIAHEQSHLSQGHYYDLFIIEMISIIQWFNPIIWLFERSIKEVHEFLADEAVLNTGKNAGQYQALLVNQALGGPVFILTNQFNQSLIKKRIQMMKSLKSSRWAKFRALFVVPVIALLMLAFASPQLNSQTGEKQIVVKGNICDRFTGKPVAGANLQIKGTLIGTVTDLQGNYQIMVNSTNDVLVVTFTGYRTQQLPVGKNSTINVRLEQDIVAIDFSQGNMFVLRDKTDQKQSANSETTDKPNGDRAGKPQTSEGFVFVEEMPAYPGGTVALGKFILDNIKYPEVAKKAGIEGSVLVSYIIDTDGQVRSPQVIRGLSPEMDQEAIRVTELIKGWKPAMQGGRPVATTVTMPVEFRLDK